MSKIIYLSKMEQFVLKFISGLDIITIEDLHELFPELSNIQINKICSQLASKGYLYRLKKGIYIINEEPSSVPIIKDPYRICQILFGGYIGFSSALRIYDLLPYEPFTIFTITKNKSREYTIGEYIFKAIAMGDKAIGMTHYRGIYVSTLEKTFFDCLYKPQYCGGYSTITQALYESKINWDNFITYFDFASPSLCQRSGYVLEILKRETDLNIPERILQYLKSRIKNKTKLIPTGKSVGKYVKDWLLLDNLGKENILSWWYYG
ncbi:MAG: hypothetical protein J7L47_03970 [Candidatus Odinarchaeota archaeon]|nr:hypothetical protein [Candidatus Odinarchaeota archaeon]